MPGVSDDEACDSEVGKTDGAAFGWACGSGRSGSARQVSQPI